MVKKNLRGVNQVTFPLGAIGDNSRRETSAAEYPHHNFGCNSPDVIRIASLGRHPMTTDALRPEFETKSFDGAFTEGKFKFATVLTFIGYVAVFVGYAVIFIVSLITIGFLEIRQANMTQFNDLISNLETRDRYAGDYFKTALAALSAEREAYRSSIDSLVCFDIAGTSSGATKTCAEIKETLQRHLNELASIEDETQWKSANLALYYDKYKDGIVGKAPQIIFVLRMLDTQSILLTWWARSPFELIQMFLLVCMGLLGGVISVMRCFVDPSLKSPSIAEFFYKPAAGAAISLGVYVLFRAAQIFLGVQNQGSPATVSTSVFLLAGLGLASGFCASQALATIELVATRLLRASGGEAKSSGAGSPPQGSIAAAATSGSSR